MLQKEIEVEKYLYSTDTSIRKTGQGVTQFTGDAGERLAEPHCRQVIGLCREIKNSYGIDGHV
jgi:hypothetical protein